MKEGELSAESGKLMSSQGNEIAAGGIRMETASRCPVCRGEGDLDIEGAADPTQAVGGRWDYKRCRSCRSLWMDPRPANEEIAKLYPASYYTHSPPQAPFWVRQQSNSFFGNLWREVIVEVARRRLGYGECSRSKTSMAARGLSFLPALQREAEKWCRFLPAWRKGRLLDVGCGNGSFLRLMHELGWEAEGLEPDPTAAREAEKLGVRVIVSGIEEVELEPESYDAITLSHVIEHLPSPERPLRNLVLALKPGGILISISPNPRSILAGYFGRAWRSLEPPRHLVLPSAEGYQSLCKKLGLDTTVLGCWTTTRWIWVASRQMKRCGRELPEERRTVDYFVGVAAAVLQGLFLPKRSEEIALVATRHLP